MVTSVYVEDLFLSFYNLTKKRLVSVDYKDQSAIFSLAETLNDNKPITKSQSNLILRLLDKYQTAADKHIPGVGVTILTPSWKMAFREVDNSKKLSLETDSNHIVFILAKFPFAFKETFLKEFLLDSRSTATWDPELKVQRIKLLDVNIVSFIEAARKHRFEIDYNLIDLVERVEELWSDEDNYVPHAVIKDNSVHLVNASQEVIEYYQNNKTENFNHNILLAKSMGYVLKSNCENFVEAIAANHSNKFWITSVADTIKIISSAEQYPAVIILDRASNAVEWTKNFVDEYLNCNLPVSDLKICYRFTNTEPGGKEFNEWVKDQELGKDLTTGKIFICLHKPPKWMIKDEFKFKAVITNAIYPSMNTNTDAILDSHSLVIYSSSIKPSEKRNNKIVEL
jgi:hypothetical protein